MTQLSDERTREGVAGFQSGPREGAGWRPAAEADVPLPWESIDPDDNLGPAASTPDATPRQLEAAETPAAPAAPAPQIVLAPAPSPPSPLPTRAPRHPETKVEAAPRPTPLAASVEALDEAAPPSGPSYPEGDDSDDSDDTAKAPARGGGWTLPLLCAGVGLIACCLIIPQADQNRRASYQKKLLEMDLASIQQQVSVNDEFLKRVGDDPTLAERLAQRQMNIVREGSRVWRDQRADQADEMSPYQLVNVPRPAPLPAYRPLGGWFASLCRRPRTNLYLTGVALMLLAAGLVLGISQGE